MIKIDVRRKAFGEEEVLRDIRFEMDVGETVAILGPSGIGKSTLLRLIAGIDPAFDGEITRPEKIAMVFQEPVLLPWRSVVENLTLVHPDLGTQAALSALERTGIVERQGSFLANCRSASSGGWRWRVLLPGVLNFWSWTSPMCRSIRRPLKKCWH
ncbi:ATP-binding cassette domain-containing protein [Ensifer aridi]|uniref:ATP-binding cassette domain-containing protein n=1 Tax=Ensifer aridi TaxID=1708715 RepID=UPI001FCCFBED|nr:ATP-binding cassette domain-containing protein [Ensifer aridi]